VAEPPAPGEPPVEEAPAADDTAATDAEEIVVTGSRVRRTSFSASAPVQTIDRREIEYSGATNMADLIQHLTVSSGSGFQGSAGSFPGTPHLNLRGLGSGRTLVLLNGRRMPYSASGIEEHYADIGTIPLAAVERVEVLKGGASAIYGSDAIAGVVNIITRKDWDGARIELNGQTTEEFDQQEGTGSLAIGATSERSRVSAAVNYFRSTELTAGERDFTRGPPSDWRGYRQSEELKDALMSQGVSILGNPGAFGAPVPAADPRCAMAQGSAPFDTVVRGTIPAQFCGFDFRPYSSLSPAVERVTTYGYGEYDLTHHTTAFAELNVSRMRGDNVYSPSFPILAFPTVPAGHVDNPAGADQTFYGRALGAEAGGARSTFGDDTVRGVLGLKGDFEDAASGSLAEDWEWEIYASLGVSRYNLQVPDTLAARFGDALAACSDPADLNGCFNPYYSSVTGSGTPNSNAVIDSFSGRLNNITDHWLHTYSAGLNGPILELPGGDLAFALGGELRREMRTVEIDHDSNVFAYNFLLGNSDADADRHVVAGYLELVWPFYDGVEVQTAGRIENYSDVGLTANPTLGLLLTPAEIAGSENVSDAFKRLQLRGHLASAFRAPTIIQTFPGSATVPDQFSSMGNTYYLPVHYHGNPNLDHEQAITVSGGFGWNIVRPITLEADYWHYDYDGRISVENPQVVFATQRSAVELFDPPLQPVVFSDADPTLPSRVNASQVNIDGSVIMDGIDFGAWVKLDEEEFGVDVGTFRFGAGGTYTLLYEIPRFERVGADEVPTVFVQTDPDGDGNAEPVDPENCDAETCDVVGQLNLGNLTGSAIPALKMNFPVSWAYDGHMIVFTGHYIGPMKDDEHYDIDTGAYNEVDAIVTFDAQYGYTIDDWIGEALTLRVGVYNLFDQDPPFVDDLTGFAPTTHDPRGRMFYAKMIGEF
jgi:outer membrane receptor protein involved in Fe transport